jgi:C2 domain
MLPLQSYLALRFRLASADDVKFISLGMSSPVYGIYAEESFLRPRVHPNPALKRNKRKSEHGRSIEYRVKPFPDPSRPEQETKWLTPRDIEREAMEPSSQWIEAGSGSVGKMHVEVIGCDGLPNLDFSITGRDKTDPFVCIVYEDCIVNTDVINDCLSPRWMPWTQRAFIFNVMHPSSQLYVGVFDHDQALPGHSPKHDKVGRAVINLTNCVPGTVLTTRFHLHDSDEPDRKTTGTLILRIRYECNNERKILLSELQLRTQYHVSTSHRSDFRCAYYALANDVSDLMERLPWYPYLRRNLLYFALWTCSSHRRFVS